MQFNFIKTARQLTDIANKNSEIVQPYVKPSHITWVVSSKCSALRATHRR